MAWILERYIADPRFDEKACIMLGSGGSPDGVQLAPKGALACRRDGATADLLWYVNTDGASAWSVAFKPLAAPWYTGSVTPAADDVAGVHAAHPASGANAFPGPITAPDVPRALWMLFGVGWDGGNVTVVGTDQFDAALTETFASPGAGGGTVIGSKAFKTVTSITKAAVGASGATCQVGRYHKLGVTKAITAVGGAVTCDDSDETVTWGRTYSTFSPSNLPDGSHVYRWAVIG